MADTQDNNQNPAVTKMLNWLQSDGYRAAPTVDGQGVSSGTSGLKFLIFTYEKSIQFYMGMSLTDEDITHKDCNDKNREWRYLKITLTENDDLSVEMDMPLDCSLEETKDDFLRALQLWDNGLGQVKMWLLDRPFSGASASKN